jgi:hypothetical protein
MKQAELKTEAEITRELKAYSQKVASELSERLLKGDRARHKATYRRKAKTSSLDQIEQSYDQLDGKWRQWLEVARRFNHKAKAQDRLDLRHTIIVAFDDQQARNERLGKPDLSLYGMLRIASHCVADYWREINKPTIRVCVLNGRPQYQTISVAS